MTITDPLIRDAEGAAMLGCSKATFWRRVADGTIPPAIKIGGTSRWRKSDIEGKLPEKKTPANPDRARRGDFFQATPGR